MSDTKLYAIFGIILIFLALYFEIPSKLEGFLKKISRIRKNKNREKTTINVVKSIRKILIEFENLEDEKNSLDNDIFSKISEVGFNEISKKMEGLKTYQPEPEPKKEEPTPPSAPVMEEAVTKSEKPISTFNWSGIIDKYKSK